MDGVVKCSLFLASSIEQRQFRSDCQRPMELEFWTSSVRGGACGGAKPLTSIVAGRFPSLLPNERIKSTPWAYPDEQTRSRPLGLAVPATLPESEDNSLYGHDHYWFLFHFLLVRCLLASSGVRIKLGKILQPSDRSCAIIVSAAGEKDEERRAGPLSLLSPWTDGPGFDGWSMMHAEPFVRWAVACSS